VKEEFSEISGTAFRKEAEWNTEVYSKILHKVRIIIMVHTRKIMQRISEAASTMGLHVFNFFSSVGNGWASR
jgi:hypothetical protein